VQHSAAMTTTTVAKTRKNVKENFSYSLLLGVAELAEKSPD